MQLGVTGVVLRMEVHVQTLQMTSTPLFAALLRAGPLPLNGLSKKQVGLRVMEPLSFDVVDSLRRHCCLGDGI